MVCRDPESRAQTVVLGTDELRRRATLEGVAARCEQRAGAGVAGEELGREVDQPSRGRVCHFERKSLR